MEETILFLRSLKGAVKILCAANTSAQTVLRKIPCSLCRLEKPQPLDWRFAGCLFSISTGPFRCAIAVTHGHHAPPALQRRAVSLSHTGSPQCQRRGAVMIRHPSYSLAGCSSACPTMLSSSTIPKGFGRKFSPALSSFALLKDVGE